MYTSMKYIPIAWIDNLNIQSEKKMISCIWTVDKSSEEKNNKYIKKL